MEFPTSLNSPPTSSHPNPEPLTTIPTTTQQTPTINTTTSSVPPGSTLDESFTLQLLSLTIPQLNPIGCALDAYRRQISALQVLRPSLQACTSVLFTDRARHTPEASEVATEISKNPVNIASVARYLRRVERALCAYLKARTVQEKAERDAVLVAQGRDVEEYWRGFREREMAKWMSRGVPGFTDIDGNSLLFGLADGVPRGPIQELQQWQQPAQQRIEVAPVENNSGHWEAQQQPQQQLECQVIEDSGEHWEVPQQPRPALEQAVAITDGDCRPRDSGYISAMVTPTTPAMHPEALISLPGALQAVNPPEDFQLLRGFNADLEWQMNGWTQYEDMV